MPTQVVALLVALLAVLLAVLPASGARAERAAVLELQAPGLLPGAQRDLDAAVRESVAALGYQVQPLEQTRAAIEDAMSAGLQCVFARDECALKVGLIAEVQAVVTTSVEIIDDRMVLRGLFVQTEGTKQERRRAAGVVVLPAADGGASLRAFVLRLVTGRGPPSPLPVRVVVEPVDASITLDGKPEQPGVRWLLPGDHALAATAPGYTAGSLRFHVERDLSDEPVTLRLEAQPARTLTWVGWTAAGVGSLMTLGGGVGAGVTEVMLNNGLVAHDNREAVVTLGLVGLGTAAAGLVVVGVGVAVALTDG
ncbi:MAG: hypothetical protein IT383_13495 [Deltaproteobacteria bacterium]|nr:hypothetical protein [Deltaproteobacteria bacterium]